MNLDFRKSKGADVIQLLVSIYDSKEVFVKELQVLLAQRLLVIRDYSFDKEVSSLYNYYYSFSSSRGLIQFLVVLRLRM